MRREGLASAGFFATPPDIVAQVAPYLALCEKGTSNYLDPCAGKGEAILQLIRLLHKEETSRVRQCYLYSIEMEASRHEALKASTQDTIDNWQCPNHALLGDAFQATWKSSSEGVGLLWLNPPYDLDKVHGRLEQKFLNRFASTLTAGGILVFLVPYYALKASAAMLATRFKNLQCFRFSGEHFDAYKQVVLFAEKREVELTLPDPTIETQVLHWAERAESIPELGEATSKYVIPATQIYVSALTDWVMQTVDTQALIQKHKAWAFTDRSGKVSSIPGLVPEGALEDLLTRQYPLAMPPRSAHIAAGIAAGVFNGERITPDTKTSALPDILVKGVFDKEYRTVDEKLDKNGEVKGLIQVQQPKLVTTVLDLSTNTYTTITPSTAKTDAKSIPEMTMADFLGAYGEGLMGVMLRQCPVLHNPDKVEDQIQLEDVARPLYKAQAQAAMAAVKLLGGVKATKKERRGKAAFLLGEIGSGKCLGINTLVLKYSGEQVFVEDVKVGDLLIGPDSKPREVLSTTRGWGSLYEVQPIIGDPWVCNDAHILTLVHTMSDDVFDIPIQEYTASRRLKRTLSKGYLHRKLSKFTQRTTHPATEFKQFFPAEGVNFPPIDPPKLDPYFLGLWYGDGTKDKSAKKGVLAGVDVTSADAVIVSYLKDIAAKYHLKLRKSKNKTCPTYSLSRGRSPKKANLVLNLLREEYGDGSRLPISCTRGSREVREAFLAGFMDSDGHLSQPSTYDFIQKRYNWSEDVCFIARSLGIRATMNSSLKSAYRGEVGDLYWRVCLSGELTRLPLLLGYKRSPPRALVRRNKKSDPTSGTRRTKNVNRTGITCVPVGEGEYAGFELSGDGRFLLGDFTVTHNTSTALSAANTINAKSILVMCPPHLLNSWQDQINAVVPWYENYILSDINDVIAFAKRPKNSGPAIAILSRESAKLGHAYTGLQACGDCGTVCPVEDPVKKRYRCEHRPLQTKGDIGRLLYKWLNQLSLVFPEAFEISQWLDGQYRQKVRSLLKTKAQSTDNYETTRWSQMVGKGSFDALVLMLLDRANTQEEYEFLRQLLVCDLREEICLQVVRQIYTPVEEGDTYRHSAKYVLARKLLLLLPRTDKVRGCINECRNIDLDLDKETSGRSYYSSSNATIWEEWAKIERKVLSGEVFSDWTYGLSREGDKLLSGKTTVGQRSNVIALASTLAQVHLKRGKVCNEPLFQAIPEPRRFPLATFISRYYPELFDLFVCDEVHEYASEAAAQTMAAQSVISLGIPTLALSGTIMTGYAQSLFMSMWALNPDFRKEFERDDMSRFVDRFGYRKRLIEDKEVPESKVIAHGAMSDRIETTERMIGNAPGILPIFILKYLLPLSVTLHKSDLQIDIPKCTEHVGKIKVSSDLKKSYEYLQNALMKQIASDRKDPDLAGKLWGAMAELPSYLDMATEGNSDTGNYEIRYPQSVGGKLIASVPCLPISTILPKEEWMLSKVKELLDAGRNVLVFGWHVKLLPRLAKLIESKLGVKCVTLNPTKVPTGKREAWINKEVINKGIRVMVVNPLTVSTGLNCLTHFSDEIWAENPACNPIIYRQAVGRVDRIGQERSTNIWFPTYEDTAQEELHSLLMHKVAVSMSTDGLDAESAMTAAGIGDSEGFSTFAVGRQLYDLLLKNRQFQLS